MNTPTIWDLQLPLRALKGLLAVFGQGVEARDIAHLTDAMVLCIPGCGRKSFEAICDALADCGMSLGTEPILDFNQTNEPFLQRLINPEWQARVARATTIIADHKAGRV